MNIRETRGGRTGRTARFPRERLRYFQAYAAVRTEVTDSALTEFMKEIKRIPDRAGDRRGPREREELSRRELPAPDRDPDQIAQQVVEARCSDSASSTGDVTRRTAAVTVADVSARWASTWIRQVRIVLVGARCHKGEGEPFGKSRSRHRGRAALVRRPLRHAVDYQYDTSKLGGFKATYALNVQTMAIAT